MRADEIINQTTSRGEAVKLQKLTGKDHDLWSSYGRPPRTPETPTASGNYSPVYYYLQYFHLRHSVNPQGAIKMHRLVNQEIEETLDEAATTSDIPLLALTIGILTKATETIKQVGASDIEDASKHDLILIDGLLGDLEAQVETARARVRAENKRREVLSFRKAS